MKNTSMAYLAITVLLFAAAIICLIEGSVAGAAGCFLIGAAGLFALYRANRKAE